MEKRLLLAVVLMTAAIMITNLFFPPAEPPIESEVADSVVESSPAVAAPAAPSGDVSVPLPSASSSAGVPADSVVVLSDLYRYVFSTRGAALLSAELLTYPSYSGATESVQLVPEGTGNFLASQLVVGSDTVDLTTLPFTPSASILRVGDDEVSRVLEFRHTTPEGFGITVRYAFDPARYLVSVTGSVSGLGGRNAELLTSMGPGLGMHEHPDHHNEQSLAVVSRSADGLDRISFGDVDGQRQLDPGLIWVGLKDKFFLAAIVAGDQIPLESAVVADRPDVAQVTDGDTLAIPRVELTAVLPVAADGTFGYEAYLGPQEFDRLSSVGHELEEVTPYGYRWLQPFIRPLAAAILWVLGTLHNTLGIAYGWVLVMFGVLMRIVLWPLNAKALRAQLKNMSVQPLVKEIREKFKNDPQKQQEAMLSLYKEHGFNPVAGCLPMLLPFPVTITLYFVFRNTITFRGVDFLWLPDLSLPDPFYLLPAVLVVSMFALQWVSAHLSGIEQNPQMKMMMYFMPVMMGAIFFMLPAGLNLYYAVTQVASIPQQILIAGERRKAQAELKTSGGPKLAPDRGGARRKSNTKR